MNCWIIQASKHKSSRTILGMQQGINSAIEDYSIKETSSLDSFIKRPQKHWGICGRGFLLDICTISFKQINLETYRKNKKDIFYRLLITYYINSRLQSHTNVNVKAITKCPYTLLIKMGEINDYLQGRIYYKIWEAEMKTKYDLNYKQHMRKLVWFL